MNKNKLSKNKKGLIGIFLNPYVILSYLVIGLLWALFRNFTAFSGLPFDSFRFIVGSWLLFPLDMIIVIIHL